MKIPPVDFEISPIRGKLRLNGMALLLAERLICCGARPSFVKRFVPLSDRAIRQMYRNVWKRSSPRGRHRQNIEDWWVEGGWSRRLTGGLFYTIHRFFPGEGWDEAGRIWDFASSYRSYAERCKTLGIECADIEMCWNLLAKIRTQELVVKRCPQCLALFIALPLTFPHKKKICLYCLRERKIEPPDKGSGQLGPGSRDPETNPSPGKPGGTGKA
jgi:hypothetical protein